MLVPGPRSATPLEQKLSGGFVPTFSEEVGTRFMEGLDYTLIKHLILEARASSDVVLDRDLGMEEGAYQGVPELEGAPEFEGVVEPRPEPRAVNALSKEEWKKSEWYRPDIPYTPIMTPTRARIMAEVHDERLARRRLLSRSPGGFFRGLFGLGAEILGNALDPVNYIPIVGLGSRAAVLGRIGRAAADAAIGTIGADVALAGLLRSSGEHMTWQQAALDVMFAGAIGSAFGAGAGLAAKWRGKVPHAMDLAVVQRLNGRETEVSPVLAGDRLEMRAVSPELETPDFRTAEAPEVPERPRPEREGIPAREDLENMSPSEEATEQMFADGQLRRAEFLDDHNRVQVVDEEADWRQARQMVDEAQKKGELLAEAARCLAGTVV